MEWRYSTPVDPHLLHEAGVFTILPVRRHKNANVAKEALESLLQDCCNVFGDDRVKEMPATMTKDGEMNAFILPEALPQRLTVATRLNDIALLHDDLAESMDQAAAIELSRDFDVALDIHFSEKQGAHVGYYRKILAKDLYELIRTDRVVGEYLLGLFSKNWLQKTHQPENFSCSTWNEFIKRRMFDAGIKVFFAILEFASGFHVHASEKQLSDPLLQILEEADTLMNDYFSYDHESYMHRMHGARIFNSIHFLMQYEHLSVQSAKSKICGLIQELERRFLREKAELYQKYPALSQDHKRYIEHCEVSAGGAHYWCAIADRYHYWKDLPGAISEGSLLTPPSEDSTTSPNSSRDKDVPCEKMTLFQADDKFNVKYEPIHHNQRSPKAPGMVQTGREATRRKILEKIQSADRIEETLNDSVIQAPFKYIQSLPSKGVRRMLIESFDEWLEIPKRSKDIITKITELLHSSSLMLDDCEDASDLRRGKPATHMIFGQAQTINTATFMIVQAIQEAAGLNATESVRVLLKHIEHLSIGQSWDLYWRAQYLCPTEVEYLEMIDKKTGGLFNMLTDLMQLDSPNPVFFDFDALVHCLGRYFQIRDDYVNLTSRRYSEQKGFCEDLDEGKISYPLVICAVRDKLRADQILGMFRQYALSLQQVLPRRAKEHILELLTESGAMDATRTKLKELEAIVDLEIARLEDIAKVENPMLKLVVEIMRI